MIEVTIKTEHSLQEIQNALDIIDNNHTRFCNYDYSDEELVAAQSIAIDILQQIEE